MNTPLVAALTAALVGAGAAVVTTTLTSEPAASPSLAAPQDDPRVGELAAELARLRDENASLSERLAYLESRPARVEAPRAAAEETAESVDAETKKLVAAMTAPGAEVPPELEDTVRRALSSIRDQEAQERQREAEEAAAERVDERMEELREQLGLTGYQTDQMRTAMLDFNMTRTQIFQQARDSGDWGSMRETMRDAFSGYRENLEQILTPIQLEQYEDMDRFRGGPPGRGDDGGGRRGGGDGDDGFRGRRDT